MTRLYFVRHGQSVANREHIFAGWADYDLSERGFLQAECTAKELSSVSFDAIYSSDLIRAYHTAEPHLKYHPFEITRDEALREIYVGDCEGVKMEVLEAKYPDLFPEKWINDFGDFAFPGGESVLKSAERFKNEVLSIAKAHPDKTVLIVTHAGILRAFFGLYVLKLKPSEIAEKLLCATNASYSVLDVLSEVPETEAFHFVSYSNDAHLGDLLVSDPGAPDGR